MPNPLRPIAVFDFDHTLITGDSFWPFLIYALGLPRTFLALVKALIRWIWQGKQPASNDAFRTFIKAELIRHLLAGIKISDLTSALERLSRWRTWKEDVRQTLLDHHAKGHHIVIASGGLDLYLPELLKDLPYDALICTEVGVKEGVITGEMIAGNCVRQRKAELVAEYLAAHGPVGESWGYGNYPHDVPMLQLLKHRIIV